MNVLENKVRDIYSQNYALQLLNKFRKGDTSAVRQSPQKITREYQQAIFNKEWERKHPEIAKNIVNVMNTEADAYNKQLAHKVAKVFGLSKDIPATTPEKYLKQTISYENYNPVRIDGVNMVGAAPTAKFGNMVKAIMAGDPSYNAQNSVGSANYYIDSMGNVTLKDRYNINKGLHMGDKLADLVHTWAKHQPQNAYDINLNLGNINDWNMQYTGNDYLREINRDRSNLLGNGIYDTGYQQ